MFSSAIIIAISEDKRNLIAILIVKLPILADKHSKY